MMSRFSLMVACFVCPGSSTAETQDSAAARVLAVEDHRFAAMLRADTSALRNLLSDSLAYTHTTGTQQDKPAFLHSLGSGELHYLTIEPTERVVRFVGTEAAIVVGRSRMQVQTAAGVQAFGIRYLAVYTRRANGWQLLAWESTRVPD
jgi:hypothetical protein